VRRNIKLAEAPSFGQTILDYAPTCPGAMDYRTLATRIADDWRERVRRRAVVEPAPVVVETPKRSRRARSDAAAPRG